MSVNELILGYVSGYISWTACVRLHLSQSNLLCTGVLLSVTCLGVDCLGLKVKKYSKSLFLSVFIVIFLASCIYIVCCNVIILCVSLPLIGFSVPAS